MKNILSNIPTTIPHEITEILLQDNWIRIERIVSQDHASADDFWYDQTEHEWVMIIKGSAVLQIEGIDEPVAMGPGDYIQIPAHQRHRVIRTIPDEPTIWLAVSYRQA